MDVSDKLASRPVNACQAAIGRETHFERSGNRAVASYLGKAFETILSLGPLASALCNEAVSYSLRISPRLHRKVLFSRSSYYHGWISGHLARSGYDLAWLVLDGALGFRLRLPDFVDDPGLCDARKNAAGHGRSRREGRRARYRFRIRILFMLVCSARDHSLPIREGRWLYPGACVPARFHQPRDRTWHCDRRVPELAIRGWGIPWRPRAYPADVVPRSYHLPETIGQRRPPKGA